jgi:hypothetical protein
MDYKLWGTILSVFNLIKEETDNLVLIRKKGSKFLFEIEIMTGDKDISYNVKLILPTNEVMLTFKDIKSIDDPINTFNRYNGSNEYYFVNGVLELRLNPVIFR